MKHADEHFIPGSSRITEIESFHRYHAAAPLCKGCLVLDAACGDGYGAAILAASAAQVWGIDNNPRTAAEASEKYKMPNLTFLCGDAEEMPFENGSFDRVVSFETIEHLRDQKKFLSEVRRVLKSDGILILSSPNKSSFRARNKQENAYHINELEPEELTKMVEEHFPNIALYGQDAFYNSVISGTGSGTYFVRDGEKRVLEQRALDRVQYTILLASASELPSLAPSTFLDAVFDPQKGYLWDDESVPLQFGLRGELEKQSAKLKELAAASELQRENCRKQELVIEELQKSRQTLESENLRQAKLIENAGALNDRLCEENKSAALRSSEYLSRIETLSQELALQTSRQEELKLLHGELTEQYNSTLLLCDGQSKKIDKLKAENRSLYTEKENFAAENALLTEFLSQFRQVNQKLSTENSSRKQEISELTQMIAQVKNMNEQLSEQLTALSSQDEAQKKIIAELQQDLEKLRQSLEEKRAAAETLDEQCRKLSSENGELQQKIRELTLQWLEEHQKAEEEHNKSEYLWGEWQEAKRSLSYRLIGQYKIRRRLFNTLRSGAGLFYALFRGAFSLIPVSYSRRERIKEAIFTRTGSLFEHVGSYQTWKKHSDLRKRFSPKGDTGLIMPAEIPLTSIVIPVYNNLSWTKRCISSIYDIKSSSPFEIIVVDDCSTENYTLLKKDFPQVRLLRNRENLGFLRTVNYGVSEAQGEYVLILNNDTEVLPGWLDELTAAMDKHPEAGMIGSQLIHLNTGTLQESGNLICKNGDMMPLGRGADPDHPQFTYFREVDFCSAASIILRKKVFDEMAGFDKLYIPAYFEDPDLGLRMQKAGYKNYVCPLSRVIHQEMASYGDALAEKCEKNRKAFMERWSPYLQEHALYSDRNEPAQCMKFDRDRVLFIDAETPMADRGSGGMDSIFFMEYLLKRKCHVVFHGEYTPGYDPKYTAILLRMGVECIYQPYHKIWEYLGSTGWSFTYLFICRIYQARCFDRLLKQYCPQASYIFDTVDVHFVREKLEAELKNDDTLRKNAADTKRYELAAAAAADAAIVISSDEKKLLENEYHLTNVYHIPQARELFGLAPNPNRRGAVFIGSAHPPNLDGLRYFHDEILPLLPRDFKLTIIGESLKMMIGKTPEYKDLLKCPQFNFAGFVQDLGTELNHAKITIAPLRYGAGTKGKVASSMAYGVPCVSSSFGTEGTGMVHGENIMIAKSPQEFAEFIKQLFNDQELWQKISDGSIKFIKENYAPETVEKMMDELFDKVKERRSRGVSTWAATPVMPKVDEV